jgi:hypothetical protein
VVLTVSGAMGFLDAGIGLNACTAGGSVAGKGYAVATAMANGLGFASAIGVCHVSFPATSGSRGMAPSLSISPTTWDRVYARAQMSTITYVRTCSIFITTRT